MFSLSKLLKKAVKGVNLYLSHSSKIDKKAEERAAYQQIQQVKEQIEGRTPHKRKITVDDLSPLRRWLYRFAFWSVLALLGVSLLLFLFQGEFHREWINPYSPATQGGGLALDSNHLAVALFGTIGIPPFVIYLALGAFLFGWWLMLLGLQHAHPVYSFPFVAGLTGQLWLLWAGVPSYALTVPLALGGLHLLLCLLGWRLQRKRWLSFLLGLTHFLLLAGFLVALFHLAPARMNVMVGLSAVQIATVVMLVIYWYLLGHDALDGTVTLSHWYGLLGLHFLRSHWLTLLTMALLVAGSFAYFTRGLYYMIFAGVVLLGVLYLLQHWLRTRQAPDLLAVNLFLLSLVFLVIAPRALTAFFPRIAYKTPFAFLSPILVYIYTTIWSFYASGPLFINRPTKRLPFVARLFLHIGWVLLATNCLLFFVAARDDMFMLLSSQILGEALLFVGLPFFLYLLLRRPEQIFIQPPPQPAPATATTEQPSVAHPNAESQPPSTPPTEPVSVAAAAGEAAKAPASTSRARGWLFVLTALLLVILLQLFHDLAVVTYSKVAYYTAQGNLALRQNRLLPAIAFYDRAIEAYPKNYKPYTLKAVALQKLGYPRRSIKTLEKAAQLQPRAVDTWLHLGSLYRRQKKYKEALQAYQHALQLDQSDSFIYRNIGLCYSHMGQHQKALNAVETALTLMPGTNEFGNSHYPAKGAVLYRAGQYRAALRPLHKALQLNPNDYLALSDLGLVYQRLKKPQKALRSLRKAHRLRPDQAAILSQLLSLLRRLSARNPSLRREVLRVLRTSSRASPHDWRIAAQYVDTLLHLKQYKVAARRLASTLDNHPNQPKLLILQARLALKAKRYKIAKEVLNQVHKQQPHHKEALRYLAFLALQQKQYNRARQLYDLLLQHHPRYLHALFYRAYLYRREKKPRQAYQLYKKILRHEPDHRESLFFAGLLAVRSLRNYKAAFRHYHRLLHNKKDSTHPNHILSLRYYGLSAIRQRPPRLQEALDAYQRILKLKQGRDFGAASNLSIIYGASKQFAKQAQVLRLLLQLRPHSLVYRLQRALALRKAGQLQQAITAYRSLYNKTRRVPTHHYNRLYRKKMRGFSRKQVLAYARSSIVQLRRQLRQQRRRQLRRSPSRRSPSRRSPSRRKTGHRTKPTRQPSPSRTTPSRPRRNPARHRPAQRRTKPPADKER